MACNRLALPQSWFRRSALWNFWMLDRFNKTMLFFRHGQRKKTGMEDALQEEPLDAYDRLSGTSEPAMSHSPAPRREGRCPSPGSERLSPSS